MNNETKKPAWVCTDQDENQYGRAIGENLFEFKDKDRGATEINLNNYTIEKVENVINSYGYTLFSSKNGNTNIVELYQHHANWIIAECLFESL